MSKVVKYFYTSPIYKLETAGCKHLNKMAAYNLRMGKRYTFAAIYDDESKTIKFGKACCQSVDNFCKKIGREIATANAESKPWHIIENFEGRRNDYADEVMRVMIDEEIKLLRKDNPQLFNPKNSIL